MTIRKIFVFIAAIFSLNSFGQKSDSLNSKLVDQYLFSKKNSVNFEAFGHGLYYSLSYERILLNNYHYKLGVQIGASVYAYPGYIAASFPISINYIKAFGLERKHHAEIGIGHSAWYTKGYSFDFNYWETFITMKAGYRFQKPHGRWVYKILFTPFLAYWLPHFSPTNKIYVHNRIYPSGALAIGYTF